MSKGSPERTTEQQNCTQPTRSGEDVVESQCDLENSASAPISSQAPTATDIVQPAPVGEYDLSGKIKDGLRRHAKAVVVITCRYDGQRYAMAATAACELSLDPPSMLVCVNKSASIHSPLTKGADFCVNILHSSHQTIAAMCSGKVKGEARFQEGNWAEDERLTPYLGDAQASFFCSLDGSFSYGTHDVFIGSIHHARTNGPVDPLVYVNGSYAPLAQS
ncbi:hypothetical protein RBB50_006381 [Rhinocladiella similis]